MPNLFDNGIERQRRHGRRGNALIEVSLLVPWYLFLFVGVFDWGFYSHALISTAAAVRAAAIYTSKDATTAGDQATACVYALNELRVTANVPATSACNADPVIVTATAVTGVDGKPATSVTVKYHTLSLIPIPGVLNKQFWITQTLQMRLRS
jgi:Flp pilus assembly protein TadG